MKPKITVIALKESKSQKNFVPHYYEYLNLYDNTEIYHIENKGTQRMHQALGTIDFWKFDTDIVLTEDIVGFTKLMQANAANYEYFQDILKVFQVHHGHFERANFHKHKWDNNKNFVLEIYSNLLLADIVLISPVVEKWFEDLLPRFFSEDLVNILKAKFLVLPPPGLYKLDVKPKRKKFDELVFLWNHRMVGVKNAKEFFAILVDLQKEYPNIPFRVKVMAPHSENVILSNIPKELHDKVSLEPFQHDKTKYLKQIKECNITLNVSKVESFGLSVFDSISQGLVVLNLQANKSFPYLVGDKTTFSREDIVEAISRVYSDEKFRKSILKYNITQWKKRLPSKEQYMETFSDAMCKLFKERTSRSTSSKLVQSAVKELKKKALTKRELYQLFRWPTARTCTTRYWAEYYYLLRGQGVNAKYCDLNRQVIFYTKEEHLINAKPKQRPLL